MSYVDDVKKINRRYDEVIKNIENLVGQYDDAIGKLGAIQGVEDCDTLKIKLENKKANLNENISDIKKIKTSLIKIANDADQEENDE